MRLLRLALAWQACAGRLPPLFASAALAGGGGARAVLDVRDFGAVGDGEHNDTAAVQAALDASSAAPGSTVLFPPGAYLSWPLRWVAPADATAAFAAGAVLRAPPMRAWPASSGAWPYAGAYFTVLGGRNVTISGAGQNATALDGSGADWWAALAENPAAPRPNPLLRIVGVAAVRILRLRLVDAPMFHATLEGSSDVLVEDAAVQAPISAINTDGFDPLNSTRVVIRRAHIANGDDGVAVKDGCRDVVVEDCTFVGGKGMAVGSLGRGGAQAAVEGVLFRNSRIVNSTHGINIKTWQGGRGYARNISFVNISFDRVSSAVAVTAFYCVNEPSACAPRPGGVNVSGIVLRALTGTHNHTQAVLFNCSADVPCTGITLDGVDLIPAAGWSPTQSLMVCSHAHGSAAPGTAPPSCLLPPRGAPPPPLLEPLLPPTPVVARGPRSPAASSR
jgi:hypothetical protein